MHTRTHMSPQCGTFWFHPAGLGSKILKRLIELSRMEGAACIKADVFCENKRALRFLEARRWGIEDFLVLNSLIMQVSWSEAFINVIYIYIICIFYTHSIHTNQQFDSILEISSALHHQNNNNHHHHDHDHHHHQHQPGARFPVGRPNTLGEIGAGKVSAHRALGMWMRGESWPTLRGELPTKICSGEFWRYSSTHILPHICVYIYIDIEIDL